MIAPNAEVDDGYFDLILVKDMKKLEIVRNTPLLYKGTIINHPKVEVHRARTIEVTAKEDTNLEFDGELGVKFRPGLR